MMIYSNRHLSLIVKANQTFGSRLCGRFRYATIAEASKFIVKEEKKGNQLNGCRLIRDTMLKPRSLRRVWSPRCQNRPDRWARQRLPDRFLFQPAFVQRPSPIPAELKCILDLPGCWSREKCVYPLTALQTSHRRNIAQM